MTIPEDLILPTREDEVQRGLNSWLVRSLSAEPGRAVDVGPGSFPAVAAEVVADMVMPVYADCLATYDAQFVRNTFGARLERLAIEKLGPEDGVRRGAIGGSGFVEAAKIVSSGALISAGTILIGQNLRFQVVADSTYLDGDPIGIVGIDTGTTTNLDYDTELTFQSPPPGVSLSVVVLSQNDGTGNLVGLTGGRGAETDAELQERILEAMANPPAAGNNAEIVAVAQKTKAVPVEKAFVIPAWAGPGNTCVLFTLRPDAAGTRIPNSTQRGLVEADLRMAFPTDFSITTGALLTQNLTIALSVSWVTGARGFTDVSPWPPYVGVDPVHVTAVTSGSAVRVGTVFAITGPAPGQTTAFFDATTNTFKRKRILTVTTILANKVWDLTFDATLGASDTYVPLVNSLLSPWSPSLSRLPAPIVAYTKRLGPGEQFATLPDPGGRQKRWPSSPDAWPHAVTNEGLVTAAKASGAISDVEPRLPATPHATTIGTPGVSAYLQQLTDFAVFPQT